MDRDLFLEKLSEQCLIIQDCSKLFDEARTHMALPLATSLRVLLHSTQKSVGLLMAHGDIDNLSFLNTNTFSPTNLLASCGLLSIVAQVNENGVVQTQYCPFLSNYPPIAKESDFNDWWNEVILKTKGGSTKTRAQIIKMIANKDGGAHVENDEKEIQKLHKVKDGSSIGWEVEQNGVMTPIDTNIAYASLRQIAYEVLCTIAKHYDELEITYLEPHH